MLISGKRDLAAGQQTIERLHRELKLHAASENGGENGECDGGEDRDHRQFTNSRGNAGRLGGRSFSLGRTSAMQSISRIKSSGER